MDAAGRFCLGCWRTLDEIGAWPSLTEAEQRAVVSQLDARRLAAVRNDSAKSSA